MSSNRIAKTLSVLIFAQMAATLSARNIEMPADGEFGYYQPVTHFQLHGPMSQATQFLSHDRMLYGVVPDDGTGDLWLGRLALSPEMIDAQTETVTTEGLPSNFEASAFGSSELGKYLLLAGSDGTLYRSKVADDGTVNEWKSIPKPPFEEGIPTAIRDAGAWALVLGEKPDHTFEGWAGNVAGAAEDIVWLRIPAPPETVSNASWLIAGEKILLAGGVDSTGTPRRQTLALNYDIPDFFNWEEISLPLPRRMEDSRGTGYGSAQFIANTYTEDISTSATVLSTVQRSSGNFSLWRENYLANPRGILKSLIIEPSNPWLIYIAGTPDSTDLDVSIHAIPAAFVRRHRSQDDLELDMYEKIAVVPEVKTKEETLRQADAEGKLALFVVTASERREDLEMRVRMRSSRYRYMTQNTVQAYFSGNDGSALLKEYGITETPALLLMEPSGKLVKKHTGSVPDSKALFEFTGPTRAPAGASAPSP